MTEVNDLLPVVWENGRWFLRLPSKCILSCSNHFDAGYGYRVMLMINGSCRANGFGPVRARELANQIGKGEPDGSFLANLAVDIHEQADWCERMNEAWVMVGRPPDGFDSLNAGHA